MATKTTKSVAPQRVLDKTRPAQDQNAAPAVQDQSAAQGGDQKSVKAPKGTSAQVIRWKGESKLPLEAKITVPAEHRTKNPKLSTARSKAGDRFALYSSEPNMTVQRYQTLCKEKFGRSPASAMADVRWDKAAGFITIG
jgi:hypothetical protein